MELADSTLRLKCSRKKSPADPKTGFAFDDVVEKYLIAPMGVRLLRGPVKQQ